ncbi:MAG: TIGR04282 family arsenosugar biosynthesis glycosyltransferase, partial [Deltaproteobacteria bacterium]
MKLFKKHHNVLVVMLKIPIAGQVKTRLAAQIGKEDATKLYRCFIHDTFSGISLLSNIDIIAAYTPQNLISRAKRLAPSGAIIIPQKGRDLGERLQNIFSRLFSIGYKNIAIIGADSPDLPIEYIEKSFLLLKGKTGLVLGPAEDGGYYLIAMSRDHKEIFKDIPWSTDTVFKETVEKAKKAGLKSAILP